ncbi:hypothetical protein B7494_g3433 [Chlorociboria aeruginascens]|nr:hypothetical protein B7494_g3433 [Chlorociboria aeruginascens]
MLPKNTRIVSTNSKKRKGPPQSRNMNGRASKRTRVNTARSILTQSTDAALNNGELDLQAFLKAREFEIKALEDGMQKTKKLLATRAFQEVPRDMRRRTASHNVKRVPKRLQRRAGREMKEDNTPTVTPSKRKPRSSRERIRAETAKRLGILAAKKRATKGNAGGATMKSGGIITRAAKPKIRRDKLNDPPEPKSKFRKRQIHKTWLPTHLWHAKRARMTEPKKPLWRFAIPVTSTEKSYRPTHRASGARGAMAWDMSYMSTIGLQGPIESIEKVLRVIGISEQSLWETKGEKWRSGKRTWNGWLSREVEDHRVQVGPMTVLWAATSQASSKDPAPKKRPIRQVFVRIHPAAFLEAWTELLRLSKMQRPAVHVEDLRFEIGSIDITGPGSTEALLGILHPYQESENPQDVHAQTFKSLAGVTNPASLPQHSLLAFSIMDPRLRYPPRTAELPPDQGANLELLQMLASWPVDNSLASTALFDRDARFKATRFPSQKSINRRKGLAPPGCYPSVTPTDYPIPIMLLTSRLTSENPSQGTWTLLAPWKCVLPIWYGLVHYPLSSGGNPRFGGLEELRQVHFESGVPWFPADCPGTRSGFEWEMEERQRRKAEWDRRPKGKRVEWSSLDLGPGKKGELGLGWACDFEHILGVPTVPFTDETQQTADSANETEKEAPNAKEINVPTHHLIGKAFNSLLSSSQFELSPASTVATVKITLLGRGVANPCARVYRLPPPPPR